MFEPDAELTQPDGARCALWWRSPPARVAGLPAGFEGAADFEGTAVAGLPGLAGPIGSIGRLEAPGAQGARQLLHRACQELRRQGCGAALAPMEATTWGGYRVVEPGQETAAAFPGEPDLDPRWFAWLGAAGFAPWLRYCSSLCTDLSLRRPVGSGPFAGPRGGRITPLDGATALALLVPIHSLVMAGFRRQPLFRPLEAPAFGLLARAWLERLDARFSLAAFDGDLLVGLLLAHGDGAIGGPAGGGRAVVRTLVVRPGRRWAGLGRRLLEHCHGLAAAAGCDAVVHALMLDPGPSRALSGAYAQPFRRYALMGRNLVAPQRQETPGRLPANEGNPAGHEMTVEPGGPAEAGREPGDAGFVS